MGSLKTLALAGGLASAHPPRPSCRSCLRSAAPAASRLASRVRSPAASICAAISASASRPSAGTTSDDVVQSRRHLLRQPTNSAFFAGLGIGYRFNNWLRFDITGEYRGARRSA